MAGEALNPSADEETQKRPLPHPPPARAVRPRPSRLGARGGPSDSSLPPAPPAGGLDTLQYPPPRTKKHPKSLAGTWLRFVALRSAKSPLPHYFTLDREQGASFAAGAFAGAPSLEAPSLRCSSLGTSSLVAPMLRSSSLVDSLPSISLPIDATAQWRVKL